MDAKEVLMNSHLIRQAVEEKKIAPVHPLHFIMNVLGMTVLPFIAKPILSNISDLWEEEFNRLMQQPKVLVLQWVKLILAY